MRGIVGKKIGMTRIFNDKGESIPVTVIEAGPCPVVQVKTRDKHGYDAVQVGFDLLKKKAVNRPLRGHFEKAGVEPTRLLKEMRVDDATAFEIGSEVKADTFKVGERVSVTGFSKGKGFQGVVKRWGFSGGGDSHGSKSHRKPGSIGQCATPAKVWKNRKMAGQTGNRRVTVKNLEVVQVDADNNMIAVRGAVPGHMSSYVIVSTKLQEK
jgi:large subunit ribosomal protein L3